MRKHLENRVLRRAWTIRPSVGEPAFPRRTRKLSTPVFSCKSSNGSFLPFLFLIYKALTLFEVALGLAFGSQIPRSNVRFGSEADSCAAIANVCFAPENGPWVARVERLLRANSVAARAYELARDRGIGLVCALA
jgi:hypothetical protein